jgi:glutaredoxin 2
LNVNGGGILDWLSDIYPAYKEMDKYSKLYKKEIDKFAKAANESNQGHKKVFFFFTKKDDESHPNNVLKKINAYLEDQKDVIKEFEELLTDSDYSDLTLSISSEDVGIFPEDGYKTLKDGEDIQALDPEVEILDSKEITEVPGDVTEASIIPAGADE